VSRKDREGNEEKFGARSTRDGLRSKFLAGPRSPIFCKTKMADTKPTSRNPWAWIPTLYVAEGMPYALAMSVSVVLYKNLGMSNAAIAFYTSWLGLPWIIKPLWSPLVDILKTRRQWIWAMQFFIGAMLAGVALTIPVPHFFQFTLLFFWLLAFSSATHDMAADGFYMLATTEQEQSFFVGFRSVFFTVGRISAQGGLVILAGELQKRTGNYVLAWAIVFALAAGILFCLGAYHCRVLPHPGVDRFGREDSLARFFKDFFVTFGSFFQKPKIVVMLSFILLYRLGEAQLLKMSQLFLLDPRDAGGLALTTLQIGFIYNTVGLITFILGALLGGFLVARRGLKFWLWPMLLAIHLPDAVFIWLAYAQPGNLFAIGAGVAVEQFGYGFGFTAMLLYMICIARGKHQTAHYAICTGFMALGMMLPGMWSGKLQEFLGYPHFFVWVILATIPSFLVARLIPLDSEFGKKFN
jgi:MFS transporter, PAT family, beta-lactamase induction signal transducer AmpG